MKIDVYMPREDSFLLQKEVLHLAHGRVLDMGAGSGIQAETAASLKNVKSVLAVDKNINAVKFCRDKLKSKKIKVKKSDLFRNIPDKKFDTIIFNPPYLPREKPAHAALDGGKKGYEVLERFLSQSAGYLSPKGVILIVFSSLTNKDKVDDIIQKNLFKHELLNSARFFYETLFVYEVKKSSVLRALEKKKVKDIEYFASGKRGMVFIGKLKHKTVAVKVRHPRSRAQDSINNEAGVLKRLNKRGIGPEFLFKGKNFLVYEFVKGNYIKDWLPKAKKSDIKKVFSEILRKCHVLDKLKLNKEEMHHPVKHVIIGKKVKMIDFERAHKAKSPKNVTQFLQFMRSNMKLLNQKGFNLTKDKILEVSRKYKKLHKISFVVKELLG